MLTSTSSSDRVHAPKNRNVLLRKKRLRLKAMTSSTDILPNRETVGWLSEPTGTLSPVAHYAESAAGLCFSPALQYTLFDIGKALANLSDARTPSPGRVP